MGEEEKRNRIVVDTNILISALINNESIIWKILSSDKFTFFAPDFSLDEIDKYEDYILKKNKKPITRDELDILIYLLTENILFLNWETYRQGLKDGFDIAKKIDEKDTLFFAIAIYLGCSIWTNDSGFRKQRRVKILNTDDLLKLI